MADTFTTVLNLDQPEVGSSVDSWGTKLNTDLAVIDALFAATGTGTVVTRDSSDRAATKGVTIAKAAGNVRWAQWLSTASLRWNLGADSVAEGGSNAGSSFLLQRFADDGSTLLGTPITVTRATGLVTFETTPAVGANAVFHAGNNGSFSPGVGELRMWLGTADPAGGFWLIMDGRAINRTTYATLFALIGTTFGVGDGTTTFNIPKQDERVIVGKSATQTLITAYDARVFGANIGEGKHTLIQAELPAVALTFAGTLISLGALPTSPATLMGTGGFQSGTSGGTTYGSQTPHVTIPDFTPAGNIAVTGGGNILGGGAAHNVVQPALVLNYILRVL